MRKHRDEEKRFSDSLVKAFQENDMTFVLALPVSFPVAQALSIDDVQSQEMLNLLIDKYSKIWTQQYLVHPYLSKHRDYIFNSMIKTGKITAADVLVDMAQAVGYSEASEAFDVMVINVSDKDERDKQSLAMEKDYVKYLGTVYKTITGHYPTINDLRRNDQKLDMILSLWDNIEYNTGKKRKL